MKAKKSSARDQRTSKARIKDLPVSGTRARGTKGGLMDALSNTIKTLGEAQTAAARKQ